MQTRNTKQKQIILEYLKKMNHPTATEVYEELQKEHPSIGRATVFRVLAAYSETGKVRTVSPKNSSSHFDPTVRPHYHVVCKICGRVDDVALPYVEDLNARAREYDTRGFTVESHDIMFYGVCPECKK